MKKLLFIAFFCAPFSISPADNDYQYKKIKEPYTPGFFNRHLRIAQATLALCGGALTATCAQYARNEADNSLLTLSFICIGGALLTNAMFKVKQDLHDGVLTNPLNALNEIYKAEEAFKKDMLAKHPNIESYDLNTQEKMFTEYTQKHSTRCPILFLGECTAYSGFGTCIFSRTYNKKYRETFEHVVSNACVEKIGSTNNVLTYVSFGCGGSFLDLVILTKVLAQKPNAQLNIHLIAGQNLVSAKTKELLNETRMIENTGTTDFRKALPGLVQLAQKNDTQTEASTLGKNIAMEFLQVEKKYQQMLTFLESTFPNARLTLSIHDTHASYWQYSKDKHVTLPDIVYAADIQDEMSLLRSSVSDYATLCAQVLHEKPASFNAWLAKKIDGADKENVYILTLSLDQKKQNNESIAVDINGTRKSLYVETIHAL